MLSATSFRSSESVVSITAVEAHLHARGGEGRERGREDGGGEMTGGEVHGDAKN